MRDINRIDVFCDELKELWKEYPDLRLGQLISNAFLSETELYYAEDDELISKLKSFYKKI